MTATQKARAHTTPTHLLLAQVAVCIIFYLFFAIYISKTYFTRTQTLLLEHKFSQAHTVYSYTRAPTHDPGFK